MGDCDRRGQPRSFADAQIAAIAIRAGLRIATRNVGDFRPMLVAVYTWRLAMSESCARGDLAGARRHLDLAEIARARAARSMAREGMRP